MVGPALATVNANQRPGEHFESLLVLKDSMLANP
jgi:hypothetical protein